MGSMRSKMTSGEALDRDNVAGYNCAYLHINRIRAFDELAYILLCGTGVGYSVERQFISKLPEVPTGLYDTDTTIVVADSKIGWARAIKELIAMLYSGHIPKWDLSKVRAKGARLKTFGGRASGPEPLDMLMKQIVSVFERASKDTEEGRNLTSIECHDICCYIADAVVVGGVRRSAMISLSNLTDQRMATAKHGKFYNLDPQRTLANNSVAFTEKPDTSIFMKFWVDLYESKSGERGIFYRGAADRQAARTGRREPYPYFGTNPCSEIILRDRQFCNLSEVVIRSEDTIDELRSKVEAATILGTLQSTLTNFRYLSKEWQINCEEERLLGVSLTGIMDHSVMNGSSWEPHKDQFGIVNIDKDTESLPDVLEALKQVAIDTNKIWAKKLGINQSVSITCVKPSGTVSQLVDSSSGIHAAPAEYYIRTVRNSLQDPITQFLKDQGVPNEPDINSGDTVVFSFPKKSAKGAVTKGTMSAIEQLELWLLYQNHWCEHKPSCTITVRETEWMDVGAWVFKHFEEVSGISFLPYDDHVYKQAPEQRITKEKYDTVEKVDVDWTKFVGYEVEDNTTGSQEYACVGNSCEIV